jgi:hypothetical protein
MKAIVPFDNSVLDVKMIEAYNNLTSKKVPKSAIQSHPGKGGQTFTYVDHIWVTEQLQNALGNGWSWEVLHWEVFEDSVAVSGKLTMHMPAGDQIFDRSVTEVGVFDRRKGMTTASTIASAASRALCRSAMRMFGLGIEFYKKNKEDAPTVDEAWTSLKSFAKNQGVKWDDQFGKAYGDAIKAAGITRETLIDRYSEAYKILATMIGKVTVVEKMPEV